MATGQLYSHLIPLTLLLVDGNFTYFATSCTLIIQDVQIACCCSILF